MSWQAVALIEIHCWFYWTIPATLKNLKHMPESEHITTTTTTVDRRLAFNGKEKAAEEMRNKTERKQIDCEREKRQNENVVPQQTIASDWLM